MRAKPIHHLSNLHLDVGGLITILEQDVKCITDPEIKDRFIQTIQMLYLGMEAAMQCGYYMDPNYRYSKKQFLVSWHGNTKKALDQLVRNYANAEERSKTKGDPR